MARRVVAHHFGEGPRRTVYQASGLSNFVFRVYHAAGDFIVRIAPEPAGLQVFIKEQWAVAKARDLGVPVPEILQVGDEAVANPYMISRAASGREATSHPDRVRIVREVGRYAALVNSIPTTGFGTTFDWSRNRLSRNETWGDFLRDELALEAKLELLKRHRMLPPPLVRRLRATLEGLDGGSPRPALTHGDVRLKNVIVDDGGRIAAIIDWAECTSNAAPHWELSIALHDLTIDEKEAFLVGYGLSEKRVAEVAPGVKALNLVNYAREVERLAEAGDAAGLDRYRTRLSGALDLYSL